MRRRPALVAVAAGVVAGVLSGVTAPSGASTLAGHHTELFAGVWGANYVSVSDAGTFREVAQIPAEADGPAVLADTPDGRKVYVEYGGPDARTVGVIDPESNDLMRQIPMAGVQGDRAARIQRDGRYYYYSSIPDGDITQVDTLTDTVSRVYDGLGNVFTVDPGGRTLFVSSKGSLESVDVATGAVLDTLSLPSAGVPLVTGGTDWLMTSESGDEVIQLSNPVLFIDVRNPRHITLAASVPVGSNPVIGDVTPDGRELWVPNSGDGTISVIDMRTHKVVHTIATGRYVTDVAIDPSGQYAYVAEDQPGGPGPNQLDIAALWVAQMGAGGLISSRQGQYYSVPGLDTPGQIVRYHVSDFRLDPAPPVLTVTVPVDLLAVQVPGPATQP